MNDADPGPEQAGTGSTGSSGQRLSPIDRSLANAQVLDRSGYDYLVHGLTDGIPRVDPGLLVAWAEWAASQACLRSATVLLAPEAMALPLAAALAMKAGIPYLAVRKREYGLAGETLAYSETGYGASSLYVNGLQHGDRVVVVDDVLSTGGTLDALLSTLAGMDGVTVQGALIFLDKGGRRDALAKRHKVPIDVMRTIRIEKGRVVPVPPT